MSSNIDSCLIIGAGISGLLAARELERQGIRVTVIDKGRRAGGRMATRRIDDATCDHGAQFFTVRSPRFQAIVDELLAKGIVEEWARGFADHSGEVAGDGHPRYRGIGGMNAVPGYLSSGIDVRCSTRVVSLNVSDGRWIARDEGGADYIADALIMTPPAPQSVALLDSGNALLPMPARRILEEITYDPCLALMALTSSSIPDPGGIRFDSGPISWMADNSRKGISPTVPSITIHASPEFSRTHWDTPPEDVAIMLFEAAEKFINSEIGTYQLHRWRYSQPVDVYPEPCLAVDGAPPLIFAGDAFGGPKVEGAAISGMEAAQKVVESRK
ncbi:MAG: NAD(P)/FAD-dependent oxidoreductase [Blastocatellales bacterium]